MSDKSFLALERAHDVLDEQFLQHQEALLDFDPLAAIKKFGIYCKGLELHMIHEEQYLMPLFRRIGEIKRWPAKLYLGEHDKMRMLLGKIEQRLHELEQMEMPAKRKVIEILDFERTYKHLCEHHHVREHENFFPVLDEVTSAEEKKQWITRCLGEWDELQDRLSVSP